MCGAIYCCVVRVSEILKGLRTGSFWIWSGRTIVPVKMKFDLTLKKQDEFGWRSERKLKLHE